MKLSTLSVVLGIVMALPQIFGLLKPAAFAQAVRGFPRSENWGYLLMGVGTCWFLWNLNRESISDFANYKTLMLSGFGLIGILTCIYVRDFLAVRGLAVVLLLLAWFTLNTARWAPSQWRLVLVVLAYCWVIAGIWFTVSPWRLRDLLYAATADPKRIRVGSAVRLGLAILILLLGVLVF